jgi:hypothetical protein
MQRDGDRADALSKYLFVHKAVNRVQVAVQSCRASGDGVKQQTSALASCSASATAPERWIENKTPLSPRIIPTGIVRISVSLRHHENQPLYTPCCSSPATVRFGATFATVAEALAASTANDASADPRRTPQRNSQHDKHNDQNSRQRRAARLASPLPHIRLQVTCFDAPLAAVL